MRTGERKCFSICCSAHHLITSDYFRSQIKKYGWTSGLCEDCDRHLTSGYIYIHESICINKVYWFLLPTQQIYKIIHSHFFRVNYVFIWVKIQFRYTFRLFMKPSSGDTFYKLKCYLMLTFFGLPMFLFRPYSPYLYADQLLSRIPILLFVLFCT
jgi:hypothetical protein